MTTNATEETLLTPAKVAEILQVSKATAYSLLQRGEIPTVRINSLVRVRRGDLERYIREKTGLKTNPQHS
jgi:excisionase family DNA binding protein